jgi:hypothetical protein
MTLPIESGSPSQRLHARKALQTARALSATELGDELLKLRERLFSDSQVEALQGNAFLIEAWRRLARLEPSELDGELEQAERGGR